MGGNGVGQTAWIVDAGNRRQYFRRNFFVQFDVLVKLLHDGAAQRLNFAGDFRVGGFIDDLQFLRGHIGGKQRFVFFNFVNRCALLALYQHLHGAVGQLEHLQNSGHAAHVKHVGDLGLVFSGGFLGHQHDAALGLHGRLQGLNAFGAPHKQGDHHVGKNHHIAQGQ